MCKSKKPASIFIAPHIRRHPRAYVGDTMPDSPLTTPRAVHDLEGALAVLREHGSRVSTTRRALLSALFAAEGPQSVENLASSATPSLDVPSTYRNLERLEDVGLVRHVHLGHGPGLYELHTDGEREYAWCESCGTAVSLTTNHLDAARALIEQTIGYRPRFSHFPLVGLCSDCLNSRGSATQD